MKKLLTSLLILASSALSFGQALTARMLQGTNAQTGTSYTFQAVDSTKLTTFNNGSAISAAIPQPSIAGFGSGTVFGVRNLGAGALTLTCSSCTINGSFLTLQQDQGADIYSDGVNYIAQVYGIGSGGGGGSPGGLDTYVQYKSGSSFGADSRLRFDTVTGDFYILGQVRFTNGAGTSAGAVGAVPVSLGPGSPVNWSSNLIGPYEVIGSFGTCSLTPSGTQSGICFGPGGEIQGSFAGDGFQGFVRKNNIPPAGIQCCISTSQLDLAGLAALFVAINAVPQYNIPEGGAPGVGLVAGPCNDSAIGQVFCSEPLNLGTGLANDAVTGTQINKLAKLLNGTAISITTSDLATPVFLIVNNAGTTGSTYPLAAGLGSCRFDGGTVQGNLVVASSTIDADCHDAGTTNPFAIGLGQWIVGQVLSTNGGAGTYSVMVSSGFAGGAGILASPPAAQTITQPIVSGATSSLSVNNLNNNRIAQQFNWTRSPGTPATIAVGSNTVTLATCPFGIDTSNTTATPYYVYVATTGTAEAVKVTGGTCTTGAASGTIIFAALNTHSAGYTVQSASAGIQEALNDAGTPNSVVTIAPVGANTNALQIYAPLFVAKNKLLLDAYGAHIQCWTRSYCVHVGDLTNVNDFGQIRIHGLRVDSMVNVDGAQVTNVARTSNVITVTTAAAHSYSMTANAGGPDIVWLEWYPVSANIIPFHGMCTLASVIDSTHFTCTGPTGSDIASSATFGWTALENAAIEDNGQATTMADMVLRVNGSNRFHFVFVIDNDQSATISGYKSDSSGTRSTANFVGWTILGRADGGNASVLYVKDSDISLQCAGNGIKQLSGNSLHVSDTVVQGYSQVGMFYDAGLQSAIYDNVYEEAGGCANPQYSGSVGAQAGYIHEGQTAVIHGNSPINGLIPMFSTGAGTQRNYYVVPRSVNLGYGGMLYAGSTTANSGSVTVQWPQIPSTNNSGAITYDVLYTTTLTAPAPYLGSATSLTLGVTSSACSNGMCSYTDALAAGSAYTVVAQQLYPHIVFWPAGLVIGADVNNPSGSTQPAIIGDIIPNTTSSYGTLSDQIISLSCGNQGGISSATWVGCLDTGPTAGSGLHAWVIQQTDPPGNGPNAGKGRFNFQFSNNAVPYDILTFADSNFTKTLSTPGHRPTADNNDTAIGFDKGSSGVATAGLAFRAPVSLSNYIGRTLDDTNWLERLIATSKQFKVSADWQSGVAYEFSGPEVSTPGVNPASGFQKAYFKAGSGLCALSSAGVEKCTGSGGGTGGSGVTGSTGVAIVLTGTSFAPLFGQYSSLITTEANADVNYSQNTTISNLSVDLGTATGASQTVVATLRDNGADTAVTCTVGNAAQTCTDTTHSVTVTAGHLMDWKLVLNLTTLTTNVGIGSQVGNNVQTYSGNTTTACSTSGSLTNGNLTKFDANGNCVDSGKATPSGAVVGTTDTQTLTNKILVVANAGNNVTKICQQNQQTAVTLSTVAGTFTTLASCSIPANTLATNNTGVHAKIISHIATNGAAINYQWKFGATATASMADSNTTGVQNNTESWVFENGTNTQQMNSGNLWHGGTTTAGAATVAPAETTSGAITLLIQASCNATCASAPTVQPDLFFVEMIQ